MDAVGVIACVYLLVTWWIASGSEGIDDHYLAAAHRELAAALWALGVAGTIVSCLVGFGVGS